MTLRKTLATTLMATTLLFSAGSMAMAETLHVAIQEDPDTLDPATGGTYGGRQVFAALCDKLVDIDATLNIAPMLATELGMERRQHRADPAPARWRQVPRRHRIRRRSGQVQHRTRQEP